MSFGTVMRLSVGDLNIELAPIAKEDMPAFVEGMKQESVLQYLARHVAPTLEDEIEWYDKARTRMDSVLWGIWVIDGDSRVLIGNTSLFNITTTYGRIHEGESGSMIFRKEYWGRGIASAIHKARTWYAFERMGFNRITSKVFQANVASRRALEKTGYYVTGTERNIAFIGGKRVHHDTLHCLNPNNDFWKEWWNADQVPKEALEARKRTCAALKWAHKNVITL